MKADPMTKYLDNFVIEILSNHDATGHISSRERNDLEFKQSYHEKSWPKYARTMASYANNRGGFIIFGVTDAKREFIGITDAFENIKQEILTEFLNSMYSPEILWEIGFMMFENKRVGYIYTLESLNKPVVALKNENDSKVNCGDILYRYRARTGKIKYPEMRKIIDDRVEKERKMLFQHFEAIFKGGTTNVGIVNYAKGTLSTPDGVNLSVDKRLIVQILKKAKFIKEGSFDENGGQPVLKISGNLDIAEEIPVPNIEPDIQYPHIQKQLSEKLGITSHALYTLIWKYQLKGVKKFHIEITTSKSNKVHKFSDIALQFLTEKINENKNNVNYFSEIKSEYKNAKGHSHYSIMKEKTNE